MAPDSALQNLKPVQKFLYLFVSRCHYMDIDQIRLDQRRTDGIVKNNYQDGRYDRIDEGCACT